MPYLEKFSLLKNQINFAEIYSVRSFIWATKTNHPPIMGKSIFFYKSCCL